MVLNKSQIKELIGKTTIHPILFYTGKIAGYFTWVILFLSMFGLGSFKTSQWIYVRYISYFIVFISFILIVLSLIKLGKSVRLGLPSDNTDLQTKGLYKISRNPMYLGFNLLTIASMLYTLNIWIIVLGVYSILIYHFIILGEESFLARRFGAEFLEYKSKTGRYL